MRIDSNSSTDIWQLLQSSAASSVASTTSDTATSGVTSTAKPDQAQLSGPGKLFSVLQSLSKTNPDEFKKITDAIASQLKEAAANSTDPNQSSSLTQMASNFEKASQSGKFSDLFPSNGDSSATSATSSTSTPVLPSQENGSVHHGGHEHHSSSTLDSIFSQALDQIQSDLSGTTNSIGS